jgi:putative ABC transport system ATP-binding protein
MSEHRTSIRCEGVFKTFGTGDSMVRALRGVDLEVRFGEMMALVGPSGCGKTTLISILAGLLQRDEGELAVLGDDPSAMTSHDRTVWRGRNVGFIFQQFNLIPQVSILENVAVPLLLRRHPRRDALDRAAVHARMGIPPLDTCAMGQQPLHQALRSVVVPASAR